MTKTTLLAELEEFVGDHRSHGTLTCDATEPTWNGYLLTVACSCGVGFERWVTPEEADVAPAGAPSLDVELTRRSQPVDATARLNISEGFIHPSVCRGRALSCLAAAARSARV